jgi:hypothetical protein
MWIPACELRQAGFRQRSAGYWQCEGRHGLSAGAYVSVFDHGHDAGRVDVWAFHVTFLLGSDRVHFYYHEADHAAWEPGGYTSGRQIRAHGVKPRVLRARADRIAAELSAALGCTLHPRSRPRRQDDAVAEEDTA